MAAGLNVAEGVAADEALLEAELEEVIPGGDGGGVRELVGVDDAVLGVIELVSERTQAGDLDER